MTTIRDIITLALKDSGIVGVGQTPLAEDINDGLTRLNLMLGQWNGQRWLLYHQLDKSLALTGAQTYTIGPAGDIVTTQTPSQIKSAYVRQVIPSVAAQPDWPVTVIRAREGYNAIALKTIASVPRYLYYDHTLPKGTIYVWPLGSSSYELHVIVNDVIDAFTLAYDIAGLPGFYHEALLYNLSVRLRTAYGKPQSPGVSSLARSSLATLRSNNVEIPELDMPGALVPHGIGSRFNVFTGEGA